MTNYIGIIFLCLALIPSTIHAQDACMKKDSCKCVFSNGTGIDLSPSAITSNFSTEHYETKKSGTELNLYTFYYHPCKDFNVTATGNTTNNCKDGVAICRHTNVLNAQNTTGIFKMDIDTYEKLGTSELTEFNPDGHSIKYLNPPSSTTVKLICSESDDKLAVDSVEDPSKIVLAFYSRNCCLKQLESAGRSFGSTLLIIFFSFVIFYLVLGVCTKKFLMGATGIEVIPNLRFWSDLPNLVKDGWAFALNGFKLPARGAGPSPSSDPNSYDSI